MSLFLYYADKVGKGVRSGHWRAFNPDKVVKVDWKPCQSKYDPQLKKHRSVRSPKIHGFEVINGKVEQVFYKMIDEFEDDYED